MKSHFPVFKFQKQDLNLPDALWNVPHPPNDLYIQGDPQALSLFQRLPEFGLAIVGTRNPQPRTRSFLENRIAELISTPLIIISGMARGIDSIAHSSALRAGLPTIGILGTGLDLHYPKETLPLRRQILEQGGFLVSEFPPGTCGFQSNFLRRNRLIAGWTQATWVIEAGQRSGSLNTAYWAREQNRVCLALPSFPGDPALAGNQTLLDRDHAIPFWGIHSLGSIWLDLAARDDPEKRPSSLHKVCQKITPGTHLGKTKHAEALLTELKRLTHLQGGAQVQEALNWALIDGWHTAPFYAALDLNLKNGRIRNFFGTLVSTE